MGSTGSMQKSTSRQTAASVGSEMNHMQAPSSDIGGRRPQDKPDEEPEQNQTNDVEEACKMYNEFPHLKEGFDNIDEFVKYVKDDPKLEKKRYSILKLSFEVEPDSDRRKLAEYMSLTEAPYMIKSAYENLLGSLDLKCMASLTVNMVKENLKCVKRLVALRSVVMNNTDASLVLAEKVSKTGMLTHFVEDLKVMKVEDVLTEDEETDSIFDTAISILQSCSRNPATRQTLRDYNTVTHLLPFLKCQSEANEGHSAKIAWNRVPTICLICSCYDRRELIVGYSTHDIITLNELQEIGLWKFFALRRQGKLQTLFTLANLVDETENEVLLADDNIFDVLFDILGEAWADMEHRHLGFSVEELVDGMTGLAKNDSNKTVLVKKGAVPILMNIMKDGSDEEKEHATKCIWELSFDKTNKHAFIGNCELMDLLDKLKSSTQKGVSKAAQGALLVIHFEDRKQSPSSQVTATGKNAAVTGHVMISYQWSDQKTLIKIRDSLRKNGFSVWMDIDNMGGSTLQAMAEAVQNSAVVLIAMSERYKLSQNCRSEAEYAFSLEKTIVPLLMQRGYKPDGWLGIIKGTKLFFDFSGKYPYDQKASELMKELGNKGKQKHLIRDEPDGELPIVPVIQTVPLEAASGQSVSKWSQKDVHNWLTKIGLQKNASLQAFSGDHVMFLRDVSQRAPEFFFNYARTELNLTKLDDLMKFTRAVDRL